MIAMVKGWAILQKKFWEIALTGTSSALFLILPITVVLIIVTLEYFAKSTASMNLIC